MVGYRWEQVHTRCDMWVSHCCCCCCCCFCCAGYHATVFAYGQTGSGKTYTMEGFRYSAPTAKGKAPAADFEHTPPQQLGITPRAVHALFAALSANTERRFSVRCSYVQVRGWVGQGCRCVSGARKRGRLLHILR